MTNSGTGMDSREPQLIIAEKPLGVAVEEVGSGWPLRAPVRLVRPIGQLLIEADLIGEGDLARALAFQERFGGRLGSILVRLGALSGERLVAGLGRQVRLPAP